MPRNTTFAPIGNDDSDESNEQSGPDLILVSETLPGLTPTGPNGLWTCEMEGCFFVVRDADSEEGRGTIQEHFSTHVQKEDLVRQEAAFRHLPIK